MTSLCLRDDAAADAQPLRLVPGPNRIGSLAANHVVLDASGVSRHHAVLEIDGGRAIVRDLASKNGTFVNGRRVRQQELAVGDLLAFGSHRFRLAELEAQESELAIELGVACGSGLDATVSGGAGETTKAAGGAADLGTAMRALAALTRCLCRPDGADVGGALAVLCQILEAPAAWVLERDENRRPTVLSICGAVGEKVLTAAAECFESELQASSGELICAVAAGDGEATGCVLTESALALWVLGVEPRDGTDDLLRTVLHLIERLPAARAPTRRRPAPGQPVELVLPEGYVAGSSPAIRALHEQMRSLVQGDLPVLIRGETGVGKEYLARILHASSRRRDQPFVALNCAAIPADLLEAELFGVEKGAATGVAARTGTFQRAHGGTLFLDEIGDMSAGLQAKLLRALEEQEIRPVGGRTTSIDVRLVAATNADLEARIEAGSFRTDLYYRLAGCTLEVPPLRERRGDVADLVEHFLRTCAAEIGKPIRGVTVKALGQLMAYDWPGNIRELEHEVRRLAYVCRAGQAIDASLLSQRVCAGAAPRPAVSAAPAPDEERDPERFNLRRLERRAILGALDAAGGKKVEAARLLGLSRDALRRRLRRHGIA